MEGYTAHHKAHQSNVVVVKWSQRCNGLPVPDDGILRNKRTSLDAVTGLRDDLSDSVSFDHLERRVRTGVSAVLACPEYSPRPRRNNTGDSTGT